MRPKLLWAHEGRVPLYLQLEHQLHYLITSGQLPPASMLPTVRAVAKDLGGNVSTVTRAYRRLQQEGLVASTPGCSTHVVPQDHIDASMAERERLAIAATSRVAREYATSVEREFAGTAVTPFAVAAVERDDPILRAAFDIAYDVVVFASLHREARDLITARARQHRILTISGKVTQGSRPAEEDALAYRMLGRTGLRIAPLTLGTASFADPTPEAEAARIVGVAIDAGINHIDSADSYANGGAERFLGRALKANGRRDQVLVSTKGFLPVPGPTAATRRT